MKPSKKHLCDICSYSNFLGGKQGLGRVIYVEGIRYKVRSIWSEMRYSYLTPCQRSVLQQQCSVCFVLFCCCDADTSYVSGQKRPLMNGAWWHLGHTQAGINEVLKDSPVTAVLRKVWAAHLLSTKLSRYRNMNFNSICALNFPDNSFDFTFRLVESPFLVRWCARRNNKFWTNGTQIDG